MIARGPKRNVCSFATESATKIPLSNEFSCVGKPFEDKLKRKKLTWQHPK